MAFLVLLACYFVGTAVICAGTGFHPVPVFLVLVFFSLFGKIGRV